MKIKICGMKYPENIKAIQNLKPDFLGFIFYEKSARYINQDRLFDQVVIDEAIKKVGVFVNKPTAEILAMVGWHGLQFVQLHGDESIDDVKKIAAAKVKIIKAFQITEGFDWSKINEYAPFASYFLFDTATKSYGGSGKKFNWDLLKKYKNETPFFLSGGIKVEDIQKIKALDHPQLYAIDLNSKFEKAPGIKDAQLVKKVINIVRNEANISSE